jgi:hypothetical protein
VTEFFGKTIGLIREGQGPNDGTARLSDQRSLICLDNTIQRKNLQTLYDRLHIQEGGEAWISATRGLSGNVGSYMLFS